MHALSPEHVRDALIYVLALVMSVCVHEFGHAYVADLLGDRLARAEGRVTLNPLAHIDPIGTIALPLFGAFTGAPVLGWGKPVRHALHPRSVPRFLSMSAARLLVSMAGPAMNVLLAVALGVPYVLAYRQGSDAAHLVAYVIQMNLGLALFNLIPCPPLDGRSILFFVFGETHFVSRFLAQYGQYLFLLLLVTGGFAIFMVPAAWLSHEYIGFLRGLAR